MSNTILKTRFIPPYLQRETWIKDNLKKEFDRISLFPLTVIKAGPGYGKSTMLADYFRNYHLEDDYAWYSVDEFDRDPSIFIQNFISAINYVDQSTGKTALNFLDNNLEQQFNLKSSLEILINEILESINQEFYYIVDDIHLLENNDQIINLLNYFIKHMPTNFHLILSGRSGIKFPDFVNWQLKNQVHILNSAEFSLEEAEIEKFLQNQYDLDLSKKEINKIYKRSEGWIIAIDLIGRSLKTGQSINKIIDFDTPSLKLLFQYLTQEVLEDLSKEKLDFLYKTSVLQILDLDIINQLVSGNYRQEFLKELEENSIFISKYGSKQYRYHSLFQDFLQEEAKKNFELQDLHQKAAEITETKGLIGHAIFHSLNANKYDKAAELILESADKLLEKGRIESLQQSLDALPDKYLNQNPELYLYQGDIYRLKSDFNGALNSYHEAEKLFKEAGDKKDIIRVLEKLAMIYLDTVQPNEADKYLKSALELKDEDNPWQEANLLYLMAENKINEGNYQAAEEFREMAEKVSVKSQNDNNFNARVKLRIGRLNEALEILEKQLDSNKSKANSIPRSHRETVLLLSLINTFLGRKEEALDSAKAGKDLVDNFPSTFTSAVVQMRLGHAYQLNGERKVNKTKEAYEKSIELIEEIGVERGLSEPLMGKALLEAFYGNPVKGQELAEKALEITLESGDKWLGSLIYITLGINQYKQNKFKEARKSFQSALDFSYDLYDIYGQVVANYWLAIVYNELGFKEEKLTRTKELIDLAEKFDFVEILKKPTFFTSRDPDIIIPVLLSLKNSDKESAFAKSILAELGYARLEHHPGYTLKIKALGKLKLFRGYEEINKDEWKREKARELFLLFIVNWQDMLSRDYICDKLWPDSDLESAEQSFKVVLNSLKNTLEPERKPRQKPFFINRRNTHYGLNPEAGYFYDVEEFENLISLGQEAVNSEEEIDYYLEAIGLYRGDFLESEDYYIFTVDERERLKNLYLNTMDKVISYYYKQEKYEDCISYCNEVLQVDLAWEKAYYYLMCSYLKLNRRSMAIKTYKRCERVLADELSVKPGKDIQEIYNNLINN